MQIIYKNVVHPLILLSNFCFSIFCRFTDHHEHHVHFDQASLKDEFETDNCVTYQKAGDDCVVVHLGFLQVNHRYLIDLRLPHSLYKANDDEPVTLVPDHTGVPNIHCKVVASGNEFEATHTVTNADDDGKAVRNADADNAQESNSNAHVEAAAAAAVDGAAGADANAGAAALKDDQKSDKLDYHYIKVEYFAHKEKLLREELKLIRKKDAEELLKLVITARVLGKGKGTPMLRSGVHCLGFEGDDESSEQSDAPCASSSGTSH